MNKSWSNIYHNSETESVNWKNLEITKTTKEKRKQIKNAAGNFFNFTWRNVDAFETFGAFIINEKDSLRFYNGPDYNNEYTSPHFNDGTNQLTGINFKIQTISFKIGVYWINEKHYRHFIDWLNPYVISFLSFDFNQDYCYQVKLAGISDSPRQLIGYENVNGEILPQYYTEMTLKFELQGPPQARAVVAYSWNHECESEDINEYVANYLYKSTITNEENSFLPSDLPTPFECIHRIDLDGQNITENTKIICELTLNDGNTSILLYNVILQNLPFSIEPVEPIVPVSLKLQYDSEGGLLYFQYGSAKYRLLGLSNTATNGKKLVNAIQVEKFMFPGQFIHDSFKIENWTLNLNVNITSGEIKKPTFTVEEPIENFVHIDCWARTNLI